MTDIRTQLLAVFEIEQRDHLAVIRRVLRDIGQGLTGDMMDVFRRAHSLKGAARAVDLPAVEDLAHRLETLLAGVVDGAGEVDPAMSSAIAEALDAIEDIVAAVMGARPLPDSSAVLARLDAMVDGAPAAARPGSSTSSPAAPAMPRTVEAAASTAPVGANGSSGEPLHLIMMSRNTLEAVDQAALDMARAVRQQGKIDEDHEKVMVEFRLLETQWAQLSKKMQSMGGDFGEMRRSVQAQLDAMSRQLASYDRQRRQVSWEIDHASQQLTDKVENLGMVPVSTVFAGFGAMVRDIGREEGSQVTFSIQGLEQQADLTLLQALKDPVMHLLRNAVRHGAEAPTIRKAAGKPEALTIELRVSASGDRLLVEVEDDGRGMDFRRIEELAAERGLGSIPTGGSQRHELAALLFQAGFSTSAQVDRLAGRGMGLAIVEEAINHLQGTVELRPGNPSGTVAFISVPLSLSRQNLLVVSAGGCFYGLPTSSIERVIQMGTQQLVRSAGRPVVELDIDGRMRAVDIVPLATLIDGRAHELPSESERVNAAVLQWRDDHCAVIVDGFEDASAYVVETPELIGIERGLYGGVIVRADGLPALVLNVAWLLGRRGRYAGALPEVPSVVDHQPRALRTILIVDDSLTTRTLEKNLLEAQGFSVLVSVDGLDALHVLRDNPMIDLVIADIEMPRMDGFGLLAAMKNDASLDAVPVILMTSRNDDKDIQRGLELGAEAYLTKQKFDQRELLATINQLL